MARSHRAATDARLSTGYGDEAIQRTWAPCVPLDRVATARPEGRASRDALSLAMAATAPSKRAML